MLCGLQVMEIQVQSVWFTGDGDIRTCCVVYRSWGYRYMLCGLQVTEIQVHVVWFTGDGDTGTCCVVYR